MAWWTLVIIVVMAFLLMVAIYDVFQKKHAILRNYPIVGHLRYILESVGPELRQYIVTNNDEELPFSRDQRRWVYASAKKQNNYFGFGTDDDVEKSPNHLILKHAAFPYPEPSIDSPDYDPLHTIPCAKIMGSARGRKHAFQPQSFVYVSGMSYGSLSAPAVKAINLGSKISGVLHNTGEGGVSPHHDHGGELIWQIGTGYFGCRDEEGNFDMGKLLESVARYPVRAIEIKLSQGAKPGRGGVLPAAKITPEIAAIRGIPMGRDCISPAHHTSFSDADSLLDFVESIADATGLPVGIKAAIGLTEFWVELADLMITGERGVDFIVIDGGEGGTGAAPRVFSDHVALPFKIAFTRVFQIFKARGIDERIVFIGSGKLGFPESALFATAMGCDMIGIARGAMLAIGCIQAQRCHTGQCPAGVATQNKWLMRGLDPTDKGARLANYMVTLRKEIMWLTRAAGLSHPAQITLDYFEIIDECFGTRSASALFGTQAPAPLGLPVQPALTSLEETSAPVSVS